MVAGALLGAAAVQSLHAQAAPPAYSIAEVTVNNEDGYAKEYLPLVTKAFLGAGVKFIARGGKTVSVEGAPPPPRVVVVEYESLDKAQAFVDSQAVREAQAVGHKYATFRTFLVEGVSP
jgi:uncharacterized protein (DUF1330 family)